MLFAINFSVMTLVWVLCPWYVAVATAIINIMICFKEIDEQ